jgi:excisionase family DNA binding protein
MNPSPPARPLAVAPAEAARLIGCGRTKLYELLANEELASFSLGRRRLISMRAIHELIARREGQS